MWSWLHGWLVLVCAGAVVAQHRIDQAAMLSPRQARVRDRDQSMAKTTDEPTCEQLKAMWRFSKRQARAPEIMNEVNSYRDPLMYNEWPVYTALPRAAPRFRYTYPSNSHEAYGRVVTKAPANAVRTPDYDEMFGMLNAPGASGKILRYSGPSRIRLPGYLKAPQRDRFEDLKKLIREENIRDLQRQFEAEQKLELQQELKQELAGRTTNDEYGYPNYVEEPAARHLKKPPGGSRQVNQFSRYSDVMVPPPSRRSLYTPAAFIPAEYNPYAY